jgi:hypothetical protein
MGRSLRALTLLLTLPVLLAGCKMMPKIMPKGLPKWLAKRPKPAKEAAASDTFVGTIEMVNPEQRFVLVQTTVKFNLQPGWKLETRPVSGTKSVLTISPEQKLNFLSADITEGYPQKGDVVVLPAQAVETPAIAPAQPGGSPPPPAPAPAASALPPPIP